VSVVVSDTSPLHYLILCQSIELLPRLFKQVFIPPTVHRELTHLNTPVPVRTWAQHLPAWVEIKTPANIDSSLILDPGETEAICLARELNVAAILMDDRKGRNAAHRHGFLVTGTIGILEMSAKRGWLDLPRAIEMLQQTNVRLDTELIQAALSRERAWREQQRKSEPNRDQEFPR